MEQRDPNTVSGLLKLHLRENSVLCAGTCAALSSAMAGGQGMVSPPPHTTHSTPHAAGGGAGRAGVWGLLPGAATAHQPHWAPGASGQWPVEAQEQDDPCHTWDSLWALSVSPIGARQGHRSAAAPGQALLWTAADAQRPVAPLASSHSHTAPSLMALIYNYQWLSHWWFCWCVNSMLHDTCCMFTSDSRTQDKKPVEEWIITSSSPCLYFNFCTVFLVGWLSCEPYHAIGLLLSGAACKCRPHPPTYNILSCEPYHRLTAIRGCMNSVDHTHPLITSAIRGCMHTHPLIIFCHVNLTAIRGCMQQCRPHPPTYNILPCEPYHRLTAIRGCMQQCRPHPPTYNILPCEPYHRLTAIRGCMQQCRPHPPTYNIVMWTSP